MKAPKAQRRACAVAKLMGPLSLVRSSEEHAGPHSAWFWDPTRQGGGVMSDMGCHCLAVGWYRADAARQAGAVLAAAVGYGRPRPVEMGWAALAERSFDRLGVDYAKTPAEDFATGIVTYRNPESGQSVKAQFTVSWMYDKQGLRLLMDGLGPGYGFEMNTLRSPLEVFIGDVAATSVADAETALEKQQSSRGLITIQPNEPDLYGYTDENRDAVASISALKDMRHYWTGNTAWRSRG